MKIAIILGTRPEIIKMAPIIRELEGRRRDYFILHTGQHYSYNLDRVFFEQLELPGARYNLEAGSGSHAEETGRMLIGIEPVLNREKPDWVLVEGDTNSVLAGALAAAKLHIGVGHVEAGLRSYDRNMPEEINRILADHVADQLYAPTPQAKEILRREGIPEERIFITGNTIVDAVRQNVTLAAEKSHVLKDLGLEPGAYFLVTLHRQENVDDKQRFSAILEGIRRVAADSPAPVIYPVHPRSRKRLEEFGLAAEGISLVEPVDFLGFLQLESHARLILTDSGGVQEEACILQVPCVTLRDNTERPETVSAGANALAGAEPEKIRESARIMMSRQRNWANPFGDGHTGRKIIDILEAAK
ncbi:MAG: UDP-N-acetylglucosamine 2-epimerase (non-hydrolyzing) [Chloroflexota bacterium]